jgi:rhodanese-related sulfurtransferase
MNHEAIGKLYPDAKVILGDEAFDDAGNIVVYDKDAVQAYIDANAYKDQRVTAYPSIADQLDQIYHEGLDAWKATILAVKEEYPKP